MSIKACSPLSRITITSKNKLLGKLSWHILILYFHKSIYVNKQADISDFSSQDGNLNNVS